MWQHPEAMSAATSKSAWALLVFGPDGRTTVLASSAAVSCDVDDLGNSAEDVGIPEPETAGFWLWKGTSDFDGLDGAELVTTSMEQLNYRGMAARLAMHEPAGSGQSGYDIAVTAGTADLFSKM